MLSKKSWKKILRKSWKKILITIYNEINQLKLSHWNTPHWNVYRRSIYIPIDFYFKRNNFATTVNTDNLPQNEPHLFINSDRIFQTSIYDKQVRMQIGSNIYLFVGECVELLINYNSIKNHQH